MGLVKWLARLSHTILSLQISVSRGFPIAITKFCTLDNITLFDKHLECLEKRGRQETHGKRLSETPTRRETSRIMPSHETTSHQRVSGRDR
jgi:hypothetical protein